MTDARDIVKPEAFSRAIVHLQKELQQSLDEAASLRKQLEDAREAERRCPNCHVKFSRVNDVDAHIEALKGKS